MTAGCRPRVFSLPAGAPFLTSLVDRLLAGDLVPGFRYDGDPLRLADAVIYLPTRRAARALRSVFLDRLGGKAVILPQIRPLGEFDEDGHLFDPEAGAALDLAPPIPRLDRILTLAPLVQAWKSRLPAHVAAQFDEQIVVPASLADAIWLSRDLAAMIDEVEQEGADWARLASLAPEELAHWWQITLEFLQIVTRAWPGILAEQGRSNPAAHRDASISAEAARLAADPPVGPVIAAGSTGSIPATAFLLEAISGLDNGAVVLPGLDLGLDAEAWAEIGRPGAPPASYGHPQTALKKLIETIGILREDVAELAVPTPALSARGILVSQALRPSETTDLWHDLKPEITAALDAGALDDVTLVEAANEREEAAAIAVALRLAIAGERHRAALVTSDRSLARRVCSELRRFGIEADDSGGTPLADTPPAVLMQLALAAALRPGDPVTLLALIKHPLLCLGGPRAAIRSAVEVIDLVALRGGTGRPDIATLGALFRERIGTIDADPRKPFWRARFGQVELDAAAALCDRLAEAVVPLTALRDEQALRLPDLVRAAVEAFEALGRGADGDLGSLYAGDNGAALAGFLRETLATGSPVTLTAPELPDVFAALIAGETVKPRPGADQRVHIWGPLEARLQEVDTLVLGGLNEGSWPRRPEADRFMSRVMKAGLDLEPPERRIGQAAHDFSMAMGAPELVLSRAARSGDAPAAASRWLRRLETLAGSEAMEGPRRRGAELIGWALALDHAPQASFAGRPRPAPPVEARPRHFSVTEIETLRRDPYAIYARRILDLHKLDPVLRDPDAAERGSLFHDILELFCKAGIEPRHPGALDELLRIGRERFDALALPPEAGFIWWRRFEAMARNYLLWEEERAPSIAARQAELRAGRTRIGATGVTLGGRADRIDTDTDGRAVILDFKTGSSPSRKQAHTLLSPQLALEGALLARGAFDGIDAMTPVELAYVRLKADGSVRTESILEHNRAIRDAAELSEEAWQRLERLVAHYQDPVSDYVSRALPFREGEYSGDYDHLARVLEWSAGADNGEAGDPE